MSLSGDGGERGAERERLDRRHLLDCFRLALQGRGATSPNPMVGAVLVKNGRVLAGAYHRRPGEPHAEHLVLGEAGEEARGATLYTNIEPCCHQGRTPPCVDAIVAAGVRRLVASIRDPDPRVDGEGFSALRAAGIEVNVGLLAREATQLNEGYLSLKRRGRPFLVGKAALSLDGRLATRKGISQWITGESARRRAHRARAAADAVIVGVGTVLSDDPRLTARRGGGFGARYRVVLDSRLRTPSDARLLRQEAGRPLILTTDVASDDDVRRLEEAGAEVVSLAPDEGGRVPWGAALEALASRDVATALVEGGGRVLTSAFEADILDKLLLFYAPLLIGGRGAPSLWAGQGVGELRSAPRLRRVVRSDMGDDWLVEGYLHPPEPPG